MPELDLGVAATESVATPLATQGRDIDMTSRADVQLSQRCSSCQRTLPRDHFAQNQMKKRAGMRRCKQCVIQAVGDAEGEAASPVSSRSPSQVPERSSTVATSIGSAASSLAGSTLSFLSGLVRGSVDDASEAVGPSGIHTNNESESLGAHSESNELAETDSQPRSRADVTGLCALTSGERSEWRWAPRK